MNPGKGVVADQRRKARARPSGDHRGREVGDLDQRGVDGRFGQCYLGSHIHRNFCPDFLAHIIGLHGTKPPKGLGD